jgi:pyruvate formate lyase activating enzyme
MNARFYERQGDKLRCLLCPHYCEISDGQTGLCGVRQNTAGVLYANSYGKISSRAIDPIEKKPLYHFYPESKILSIGSCGCNMRCSFCQNHEISQKKAQTEFISPEQLTEIAKSTANNLGVAFTYNEPLIGFEYLLDALPLLREAGLKTVLVTNGMINPEPLREILLYIDAMNIDLKAFSAGFYKKHGGDFETVKHSIELSSQAVHIEVTTLIIPGENDSEEETEALTRWLSGISPEIPLHLSRYFPRYKYSKPPTDISKLERLANIAKQRLKRVYIGNV